MEYPVRYFDADHQLGAQGQGRASLIADFEKVV
jgi:hypothetical protein